MNQTIKIFLASSSELVEDRRAFEIFIGRQNDLLIEKGVYIKLIIWENFLDAVSTTRLQDEYNKAIRDCDIFVMLFFTKVGKYSAEEFKVAYDSFKANGRPIIYTYFKDADINTGSISDEMISLLNFKKQLSDMGHFFTVYQNTEGLLLHFSQQLDKLSENGFLPSGSHPDHKPVSKEPASSKVENKLKPDKIPEPQKENLQTIQKRLKILIAEDLEEAFEELENIISDTSNQFNLLIGLKARYNRNRKEEAGGSISFDNVKREYVQITNSLQYLIDELREKDISQLLDQLSKESVNPISDHDFSMPIKEEPTYKTGHVLYQIPEKMQVLKETVCIVRIALDEVLLTKGLNKGDYKIEFGIRLSDFMEVDILDPSENNAFRIRTTNKSSVQLVDADDFSQWKFYVKPLLPGEHPLELKVFIIGKTEDGRDWVREKSFDKSIVVVTEAVVEEAQFVKAMDIEILPEDLREEQNIEIQGRSVIDVEPIKPIKGITTFSKKEEEFSDFIEPPSAEEWFNDFDPDDRAEDFPL